MIEKMIIGNEVIDLREVIVDPGNIKFDKERYSKALEVMVEENKGLVITEDSIKDYKSKLAGLNNFKKGIEDFRKEKKREYSKPLDKFESDIKELTSKIDIVVNDFKSQLEVFEDKRKQDKQEEINEIKIQLMEAYGMKFNFIEPSNFLNATKKLKDIKAELEEQIKVYVKAENDRIEKERLLQEKKEMLEMLAETIQDKVQLKNKIRYTEIEFLLEYPTSELKESLTAMFEERKENEIKFDEATERARVESEQNEKEAAEKVEVPVSPEKEKEIEEIKPKTKTVTIQFKDLEISKANLLMQFIKENKIEHKVI